MKYIILFLISGFAYADGNYNNIIINESSSGAALAISISQLNFDWSTKKSQAGIGVGTFDNQSAVSFGAAKRFGDVLVNGSFGIEGSKVGYGAGINFRF